MKAQTFPSRVFAVLIVLLLLALTACGSEDSIPQATSTPLPRFEQVATSTEAPVIATLIATQAGSSAEDVPAINPTAAARGQGSWIRLECFTCHGQQGEGNSGPNEAQNGPAIAGTQLTEDEFIDWLRTGGSLGNDHLFPTDRLSDSGGRNLYQYVLSLGD
jgi:mono/diheme cytochrome c family protein